MFSIVERAFDLVEPVLNQISPNPPPNPPAPPPAPPPPPTPPDLDPG